MSGSSRSSLFVAASGIIEASGTVKSLTQGILDTFGLMVLGITKLCNSFSKYCKYRMEFYRDFLKKIFFTVRTFRYQNVSATGRSSFLFLSPCG